MISLQCASGGWQLFPIGAASVSRLVMFGVVQGIVYIYIYIHTCFLYVHLHLCAYIYIYIFIYTHVCVCVPVWPSATFLLRLRFCGKSIDLWSRGWGFRTVSEDDQDNPPSFRDSGAAAPASAPEKRPEKEKDAYYDEFEDSTTVAGPNDPSPCFLVFKEWFPWLLAEGKWNCCGCHHSVSCISRINPSKGAPLNRCNPNQQR